MEESKCRKEEISRSLEDYLKATYIIIQQKPVARVKDYMKMMGVKGSSVVAAMKRLMKMGLVEYAPHTCIRLTPKGEEVAKKLLKRYTEIKEFLEKVLNVPEEIALRDACKMEHALSPETIEKIEEYLEKQKKKV